MSNDQTFQLIREIERKLAEYQLNYEHLTWREKVLLLVEIERPFRKLGRHTNPAVSNAQARERIRLYLIEYVGQPVSSDELRVVSGISEYGRRARELRVQDGYKIITGSSVEKFGTKRLKPSEYLLLSAEPDHTAARRWQLINRIRREKEGGAKSRILKFLRANVGQVVTSEELWYVARSKEFGRRTRELRTEEGYQIATRFTGRPDLHMAEYVLESLERIAEPHDRKIPYDIQKAVYERDANTCRLCGWNRGRWRSDDPRILELHHIEEHASGGKNELENLLILCSTCHDEIHAGRRTLPPDILG
jgi:hypothetical protein